MTSYQFLDVLRQDGITTVTLCRPPANALSIALMRELHDLARDLRDDPQTRVLVLRSDVPGMFMAGADLKDRDQKAESVVELNRVLRSCLDTIEHLPFPTIAAIEGHAVGGGCELALVFDFRVMARGKPRIGLPEVKLGLLAAGGGTQRMSRLLGRGTALDLILRGRLLDADAAAQAGLVHEACDAPDLDDRVRELSNELVALPPLAMAAAKRAILEGLEMTLSAGLTLEALEMVGLEHTEDAREGVRAFVEKRAPVFTGR